MPCACAIACSSGWVMKPAMVCESAPKYTVCTTMVALSVFGYWRIGRDVTARKPSTRISRLTVAARTGRLMKRSVNFMGEPAADSLQGNYFQLVIPAFLGMSRQKSLLHRMRIRTERGLHLVVDVDRRVVAQLQLATGDDHVARLDAGQHGDLVT